ncbi:MAG: DEAD/DEAH box helicase, partial [Planctomycetota bacterium]
MSGRLLEEIRALPGSDERIVHVREVAARPARHADPARPLTPPLRRALAARGIERLWAHQARTLDLVRSGRDVLLATGTASGKTLAYTLPLLEMLEQDPEARALLLFPTKALCRDQLRAFRESRDAAGLGRVESGVIDGDTPAADRRRLRDRGGVLFSNPDMVHAAVLPQHSRWSGFLSRLRLLVLDEIHSMSGIFGANAANLFRRLLRVCAHHSAEPVLVACSGTIGNAREHAARLTGRELALVADDGSPRGSRAFVFWNPPRVRHTARRSRRSANVEAHELMARLVSAGVPTITFSKARVTAELIHRYVRETLERCAPHLAAKVSPYRGGYRPEERREIEGRLFAGELLGVSTTRALELGIDVGGLDACIVVGWPGTLASFFQQAGRAGRRDRDALVVLVGLDTPANQYVLRHPEYVFGRPVEHALADRENPYVLTGHLRCAAQELPIEEREVTGFGPHADLVLGVLQASSKVRRIGDRWFHAAHEVPQHEVSLRDA